MNERIKQIRRELGLTQAKFAERIGLKQNSIALIESGKRNISDQAVLSICREFGIMEEWIRYGTGPMYSPEATSELDALAEKYDFTYRDYVFMEKLCKDKNMRTALINFSLELSADLLKSGIDSNVSAFGNSLKKSDYSDIPDTPEELERKFPPLEDRDEREGGLG